MHKNWTIRTCRLFPCKMNCAHLKISLVHIRKNLLYARVTTFETDSAPYFLSSCFFFKGLIYEMICLSPNFRGLRVYVEPPFALLRPLKDQSQPPAEQSGGAAGAQLPLCTIVMCLKGAEAARNRLRCRTGAGESGKMALG